jgi:hypothetical protein
MGDPGMIGFLAPGSKARPGLLTTFGKICKIVTRRY